MKIWVDTNIILDVLTNRENFVEVAEKIFKLCEVKKLEGYISTLSIANIVYIMRKELDLKTIKKLLQTMSYIFTIVDLTSEDLIAATELSFDDYEDAIQSVCAARVKADYVVTRNIKDYKNSKVTVILPTELLESIGIKKD